VKIYNIQDWFQSSAAWFFKIHKEPCLKVISHGFLENVVIIQNKMRTLNSISSLALWLLYNAVPCLQGNTNEPTSINAINDEQLL